MAGDQRHVAIIGGGITGATCARELLLRAPGRVQVTVFDQGRGVGGRTSHRRVEQNGGYVLPTSSDAAFAFDHGCQFFRADSETFRNELLKDWLSESWAAEWTGNFGTLGDHGDFFGFPAQPPFYCGLGGMSAVPCGLLADVEQRGGLVRAGVRVAATRRLTSGKWLLSGTEGQAAFHDTAEEEVAKTAPGALGEFDVVIVTDVSASMASWHRASAGIPEDIAAKVRDRTRVALFTALVAFEERLKCDKDAFAIGDEIVWFAARTTCKPGFVVEGANIDCWTLVSSPRYAAAEIARVPMQDPNTGAFIPQDMTYLREGPSAVLLDAFERSLRAHGFRESMPKVVYVGGQRWGSAFPAPAGVGGRDAKGRGDATVEVLDVAYDSSAGLPLTPDCAESLARIAENFLADDVRGIYYAGDYVSPGLPGVESAALSGMEAARHVATVWCTSR